MIAIFKPIQDLFHDLNFFEEDGKNWIAVEVGKERASLYFLNSFVISYMVLQSD